MSIGLDFPGLSKKLAARGYPVDLATSIALEDTGPICGYSTT